MPDFAEIITKWAKDGYKLRLAPGVIGKSAMIWLVLLGGWIIILVRLTPEHIVYDLCLMGGGVFLAIIVIRETGKLREYAINNPAIALLEGAELLALRQLEAQRKEIATSDKSPPSDPKGDRRIPPPGTDSPQ